MTVLKSLIRKRSSLTMPIGSVVVHGEPARIVWPRQGDAVAVDFECDGSRYATVYRLNSRKPRLDVQPGYELLLEEKEQDGLLQVVIKLWTQKATEVSV